MIYAMSDLHGAYDKFMEMLKLIDFGAEDTLYIIGDICDRQEGGVKILKEMMKRPNIIGIAGNHEYMMLKCLKFLTQEITEDNLKDIDEGTMQGLTEWMNVGAVVRFDETVAIMAGLPKKNSAPNKEKDTMAWAEHMNMLKSMAEEVALAEVIYCE